MIDSLVVAFATILISIISLYKWVIIIGALLSWVQPDPYNPIVQMIYRLTEPAYSLVKRFIPTVKKEALKRPFPKILCNKYNKKYSYKV